jgi:hypothetical protein
MADIFQTTVQRESVATTTWATLTSANADGVAYKPERNRASVAAVQFTGTFDSATAVLQGSNDGTNWETLSDVFGLNISFSAAGYAEVSTAMAYLRPSTSGGGGSQDIDCILVARG